VAIRIVRSRDLSRHDGRALQRLELTDHAVIVVLHEHGPPRGPDDEERGDRWRSWVRTLEAPTLTDDRGAVYAVERHDARPDRDAPRTDHLPMKATVAWRFLPHAAPEVRTWTVDGRWTVERSAA
jgi:hypothetical protein